MLLTAHSELLTGDDLRAMLAASFGAQGIGVVPMQLEGSSGATLALGWAARRGS